MEQGSNMKDNTIEEILKKLTEVDLKIDNLTEHVKDIVKVTESFASAEDIVSLEDAEKAKDFIGSLSQNGSLGLEGMIESFKTLRSRMTDLGESVSSNNDEETE